MTQLIDNVLILLILVPAAVNAGAVTATVCPPQSFVNKINFAKNPSFEVSGPNGFPVSWRHDQTVPAVSAAKDWFMHSNEAGAKVSSLLTSANVPGPGGFRMLHYIAGGAEGGVYQPLLNAPRKLMFSAWVLVVKGHLVLQAGRADSGPAAWSTKINQWEQLRVCTDGSVPLDMLAIYNQDPNGGEFFVDRVEVRETP